MNLDSKQFRAILVLGYNFALHLARSFFSRSKDDQLKKFKEYFKEDGITPFSKQELEELKKVSACTACGECVSHCRVSLVSKGEFLGPEHFVLSSTRSSPDFAKDVPNLFLCALCMECEPICPEEVPVAQMVRTMRRTLCRLNPDLIQTRYPLIYKNFNEYGNPFGKAMQANFPRVEKGKDLLFLGCRERAFGGGPLWIELFSKLGVDFGFMDELCCGGLFFDIGADMENGLEGKILKTKARRVVAVCPHCETVLRGKLKGEIEVISPIDVFLERFEKIKNAPRPNGRVVFHDPCWLARGIGNIEEPREVMKRLALEVVEFERAKEFAPCCGAGGGLEFYSPELSEMMASERVECARELSASIVTACSGCFSRFKGVGDKKGVKVYRLEEMVLRAIY